MVNAIYVFLLFFFSCNRASSPSINKNDVIRNRANRTHENRIRNISSCFEDVGQIIYVNDGNIIENNLHNPNLRCQIWSYSYYRKTKQTNKAMELITTNPDITNYMISINDKLSVFHYNNLIDWCENGDPASCITCAINSKEPKTIDLCVKHLLNIKDKCYGYSFAVNFDLLFEKSNDSNQLLRKLYLDCSQNLLQACDNMVVVYLRVNFEVSKYPLFKDIYHLFSFLCSKLGPSEICDYLSQICEKSNRSECDIRKRKVIAISSSSEYYKNCIIEIDKYK